MKLLDFIRLGGLSLLVLSACLFIIVGIEMTWVKILFTLSVILLSIGRFIGKESEFHLSNDTNLSLTLRRLYRQRVFSVVILYISVAILFMHPGFYFGIYLYPSNWFMPFLIFTIVEVYTVFRITAIEKRQNKNTTSID